MSTTTGSAVRSFAGASYCIGFMLIAISVFDLATTVLPAAPGDVSWRYGTVGLLSGFTLTPLLGGLIVAVTAAVAGHPRVGLLTGVLHVAVALVLLILLMGFTLDTLQVRRGTSDPSAQSLTEMSALKAAFKLVATIVAVGWLGWSGISQSRKANRATSGESSGPVIIGR